MPMRNSEVYSSMFPTKIQTRFASWASLTKDKKKHRPGTASLKISFDCLDLLQSSLVLESVQEGRVQHRLGEERQEMGDCDFLPRGRSKEVPIQNI